MMVLNIKNDVNFYVATIRKSSDMMDFKTIVKDDGVQIRIAKYEDGSLRVQSILFPKDKYNSFSANISANIFEKFLK